MKQILSSILMVMYLSLNLGLSLQAHYCLGELRSVSIQSSDTACPCPHKAPCCEDIAASFSLDQDHTYSPTNTWDLAKVVSILPNMPQQWVQEVPHTETQYLKLCNHGPPIPDTPLYIAHQSRLIYG